MFNKPLSIRLFRCVYIKIPLRAQALTFPVYVQKTAPIRLVKCDVRLLSGSHHEKRIGKLLLFSVMDP